MFKFAPRATSVSSLIIHAKHLKSIDSGQIKAFSPKGLKFFIVAVALHTWKGQEYILLGLFFKHFGQDNQDTRDCYDEIFLMQEEKYLERWQGW